MCTMDKVSADSRDNIQRSMVYFFKYESRVIQKSYNKKQLNKYFLKDGIYYHQGRSTADNPFRFKDLDQVPFIPTESYNLALISLMLNLTSLSASSWVPLST